METIYIDIINPKAKELIQNLADLNLIKIQNKDDGLKNVLDRIRSKSNEEISLEEITAEVEAVRKERYES